MINYADYERLVHQCARKGYSRLKAAGCHSVDLEDVVQEMRITFEGCRLRFDRDKGVEFSTYLYRAIWQNFNRFADAMISGSGPVSLDTSGALEEGGLHEVIADDRDGPEDVFEQRQRRERALKRLKPLTRRVVEFLDDTPQEMLEGLRALQAKAQWVQERTGRSRLIPRTVSLTFVMNMMGLSQRQRVELRRDLDRHIERMAEVV